VTISANPDLAWRARCSVSMLQMFERGLVPVQRSEVAARLDATLAALERDRTT
jgi:hypothetical protein